MTRIFCETCEAIVPTVQKEVELPFSRGDITVNVLVNAIVCEACDSPGATHANQTPRIVAALDAAGASS